MKKTTIAKWIFLFAFFVCALSLTACGGDSGDVIADYESLIVQAEAMAKQNSVTQDEYMELTNRIAEIGKAFQEKAGSFTESDAKRVNELSDRLMTAMQTAAAKIQ